MLREGASISVHTDVLAASEALKTPVPLTRVELPVINNPVPENPCLTDCNGACCRNIFLTSISDDDLRKLSRPDTLTTETDRERLSYLPGDRGFLPDGIYFSRNKNGTVDAYILGNCPQQLDSGMCGKYEDRPEKCQILEVGGIFCNENRKKSGMKPLGEEKVQPSAVRKILLAMKLVK